MPFLPANNPIGPRFNLFRGAGSNPQEQTVAGTDAGFQTGAAGQAKQRRTTQEREADSSDVSPWKPKKYKDGTPLWVRFGKQKEGFEYALTDHVGTDNQPDETSSFKIKYSDGHYEYRIFNPNDRSNPYVVTLKDANATTGDVFLGSRPLRYKAQVLPGNEIIFRDGENRVIFDRNKLNVVSTGSASTRAASSGSPPPSGPSSSGPPPPPESFPEDNPPGNGGRAGNTNFSGASSQWADLIRMGKAMELPQFKNLPDNPTPGEVAALQALGILPPLFPGSPAGDMPNFNMMQQMGMMPQQPGKFGNFIRRHPFLTGGLGALLIGGLLGGLGGGLGMLPLLLLGGAGSSMLPLLMMTGMGGGNLGGALMGGAAGAMQGLPYVGMASGILNQGNLWGGMLTPFM